MTDNGNGNDMANGLKDKLPDFRIPVKGEKLNPFLEKIEQRMKERVVGQYRAIRRIVRALTIAEARLNHPEKPLGIMMLAGPSGVGKTHCAQELGRALIGEPEGDLDPVILIDCTSFVHGHEVSSLTGSPPGYIGYGENVGLERVGEYERQKKIPEEVKRKLKHWEKRAQQYFHALLMAGADPNEISEEIQRRFAELELEINKYYGPFRSVVIFDEIEKAHPNIHNQLLRIMHEGKLWLLNGRMVDFRGAFIILTTNVGTEQVTEEYLSEKKLGFQTSPREKLDKANGLNKKIWERVKREIYDPRKAYFKPEFLGRIGKPGIIVFNVLSYADYEKILDLKLQDEVDNLLAGKPGFGPGALLVSYTPKLKEFLIEEGVSPQFGARALQGVVDKYIKEKIARGIVSEELKCGDKILLDLVPEEKDANGNVIKEADVKILRQPRPKGVSFPDFQIGEESKPLFDVDKVMKEFFDKLLKSYAPQKSGGRRIIPRVPDRPSQDSDTDQPPDLPDTPPADPDDNGSKPR